MALLSRPSTRQPTALPYRPSVGVMLFNAEGKVWTGRRTPKWMGQGASPIWQTPQGGILKFETPRAAAIRELSEETGIYNAEIVGEMPTSVSYDLPPELVGVALKGRYRGQRQWWFAMRYLGLDSGISIVPKNGCKAEFDEWQWRDIDELPGLAVPFKREMYETVIQAFRDFARPYEA